MEPNKLSVSSNIVHKPLSVNCLTPTKECRRTLRPTLAPYILLSLTNQKILLANSPSPQKNRGEEKINQRKCVTLWGRRLHRQAKNRAAAVATPQEIEKQEAINITNRSKKDMT